MYIAIIIQILFDLRITAALSANRQESSEAKTEPVEYLLDFFANKLKELMVMWPRASHFIRHDWVDSNILVHVITICHFSLVGMKLILTTTIVGSLIEDE